MKSMRWSRISNIDSRPVFPALCGAEDGENGNPPAPGGAGEGNQNANVPADGGDPQKKIKALEEEKDRHFTKAQEAAQQLEALTPELEELRKFKKEQDEAKLSAEEKTQQAFEELETERDNLRATVEGMQKSMQELVVQQAFMSAGGVTWHDPEIALSKADLSELKVEFNDKGLPEIKNPEAIKKAAEKLKSDKPFLVKDETEKPWRGQSGPPAPGNRKQGDTTAKDAEKRNLRSKYPALNR